MILLCVSEKMIYCCNALLQLEIMEMSNILLCSCCMLNIFSWFKWLAFVTMSHLAFIILSMPYYMWH